MNSQHNMSTFLLDKEALVKLCTLQIYSLHTTNHSVTFLTVCSFVLNETAHHSIQKVNYSYYCNFVHHYCDKMLRLLLNYYAKCNTKITIRDCKENICSARSI